METACALIYTTVADRKQATDLTEKILKRKLAACVSIIDGVESHYWWQGKIETSKECLLILKTKEALYPTIEKFIREHHSYKVPELILVPIKKGDPDYLFWISKNVENI
jgi:periplasmic divalent cation tolerance protein